MAPGTDAEHGGAALTGRAQELVCIIGTDGSGKTTLATAVMASLRAEGVAARQVWLSSESLLAAPVRRVLKLVLRRGRRGDGGRGAVARRGYDYSAEVAAKVALARRHAWAVPLYVALIWTDYRIQVLLKRWRHRRKTLLVADRYLFDVAVNLGIVLGWTPDQTVDFARRRLAKMTLPQVRVFLRVPPEVSMARKDDIPDPAFVRLRLSHYEAIARAFGFVQRDGTLPVEETRDWLVNEIRTELSRPYVLYVHANNEDVGGADRVLVSMAAHMRDHGRPAGGMRVAVLLRRRTAILEAHAETGVPVILHPFPRPQTSRGLAGLVALVLSAPGGLFFFWRLLGRERPDIVHVNDLYDVLPALAARMRGIPVVWHLRMIRSEPALRRAFAALVGGLAPVSISVSRAVARHYFPRPRPGHRAEVVHDLGDPRLAAPGPDPARPAPGPRPLGLPEGGRLVVMIGRVEPWKGQDVFLRAVARLDPALRAAHGFALIGGGVPGKEDYLGRIRTQAAALGVAFLGPRDDVAAILRAADVSVHASVAPDPFPGVVVESLLAGAATIAAKAGGLPEMITTPAEGVLVPPGDDAALAQALASLLTAPETPRARHGASARGRGLQLVDPAGVDGAIAAIYAELLAPGAGPQGKTG